MADDEKGAVVAITRDDCRRYLQSLEMGGDLVQRGMATVVSIERFLPARAEHIFVSERRDADGDRSVGSLWLLGPGFMSEGHRFTTDSQFDITRVDRGIARILVERCAFDFAAANEQSRLSVTVNMEGEIVGLLEASGRNCLALQGIFERYLVPLLAVGRWASEPRKARSGG